MLHNGGAKPFSRNCNGKKTAALVMACNGISPRDVNAQGTSSHTAYALESAPRARRPNLAQSLGGGGGVWSPPSAPDPPTWC